MIRVSIPSPLHSYTRGLSALECEAGTLAELAARLDSRFPGIRFRIIDEHDRIRRHIRFFVNQEMARDLQYPLAAGDEVMIVCALSGGV